jgi:UDP-2,4-diacetamido-2,4,6-trideoxy-beta-L-altropyranose hydrolase
VRVVIRADASSSMGTGHLMRTLALAQALRDGLDEVCLVSAAHAGPLADRWRAEGATVIASADPGSESDARRTREVASDRAAHWIVLDGYGFSAAYRASIAQDARLLLVDDFGGSGVRSDVVVNGNIYARRSMYRAPRARLLLGPRYAMLRREFREGTRGTRRQGIVVSLGGADPGNRTEPLLGALAARGLRGRVVIGPEHPAKDALRAHARALRWTPLDAVEDMAEILAGTEVAVVGAGTTTLECLALGVPMVAVRIADNQVRVAEALAERRLAAVSGGDAPREIADEVVRLISDPNRLAAVAEAGRRLVDARGALRVASAMREALLTLRPATIDDARTLFEWRNDPSTRAASFITDAVVWEDHVGWLRASLASPDVRIVVAELDGSPVGVQRIVRDGDRATISVTVAPTARARGLATPLIRGSVASAHALGVRRIDAYIRPDNVASLRAFEGAGFVAAPRRPADGAPLDAVLMTARVRR